MLMRIVVKQIHGDSGIPIIIPVADANDAITNRCLDNLETCTALPLKVFLVESLGDSFRWGKSMNAGIQAAGQTDFVIGMDSDAFPKPGAIEKLIAFCQSDSRLGYVGVKIINPTFVNLGWVDRGPIRYFLSSIKLKAPFHAMRRLMKGGWWLLGPGLVSKHKPGKMMGFSSTMFFLSRRCYTDIGPFDERYRISFVDADYAYRILTSEKWFISTCPEVEVYHTLHSTQYTGYYDKRIEKEWECGGLEHYKNDWPKERMRIVKKCAKEGKFIVHRAQLPQTQRDWQHL
jgi:hypothetical protein